MTREERQWMIWWRLAGEPEELSAERLLEIPAAALWADDIDDIPVFATLPLPSGRFYILDVQHYINIPDLRTEEWYQNPHHRGYYFWFRRELGHGIHDANAYRAKKRWTVLLHTAKAMIRYDLKHEKEQYGPGY